MHLTHDGSVDIATGKDRRELHWKNEKWTWSKLLKRLSTTHRTAETYAQYKTATKTKQTEIKDVGGFVGGYLNNGRRKPGNVAHRQLITLDLDYAKPETWEDFCIFFDVAACVYSTHMHSPEAPRLRLIIPLDREVMADEYIAIGRRIAGKLGIELFDNTGFQPSRLMYYPSTSADGEYIFEYQDGPWLSADAILASYHNWQDSSEWPFSERVSKKLQTEIKKQGDPLEKPGILGAFCRTYTISEAIEAFLPDVYEAAGEDRYTYAEGSTAGGLVVYDDKYAYSHHGTDPTSEKLCNAFDLVRLHKYGLKDEDAREGTPINKMPSYTAMLEFAAADPKVRLARGRERLAEARSDFDTESEEAGVELVEVESDEWLQELKYDGKGNLLGTIRNFSVILEKDPLLKGRFAFDEFANCAVALRNLPWRKVTKHSRRLTDTDEDQLIKFLEVRHEVVHRQNLATAFEAYKGDHSFHPVKEYLSKLDWDGEPRVDTLFVDYQGAQDSEYVRAVTRKTLVAAVSRILDPGRKFDEVLTLVGEQGRYKSTLLSKLGGEWFSDSFSFHMLRNNKEAIEQVQGFWLIEIGELAGMSKAEVESVKSFLSRRQDIGRMAFKKNVTSAYRQCVFFGTTNKRDFLKDPTGNRRFWPVQIDQQPPTKDVFKDLTQEEVGQIWAEALYYHGKGEPLFLSEELKAAAGLIQNEHVAEHPWTGIVTRYLETKLPEDWSTKGFYERRAFLEGDELTPEGTVDRERVCVLEVWCEGLGRMAKDIDERAEAAIRGIMRNLDEWREEPIARRFGKYGLLRRGYFRIKEGVTKGVTKPTKSKQTTK